MKTDTHATRSSNISKFLGIAYAFTWMVWLPGVLASNAIIPAIPWPPLFALGACGPLVAAVWCLHNEGGWTKVKDWLRQGFTRRIGAGWWLFMLLVPFIVPMLALTMYRFAGGRTEGFAILEQPWMVLPIILLMVTIGGGQEEYGWRGYLLPRLDARWKRWQADIFMISAHTFWHLPLFFIKYTMQSQYPFWLFLAFGIGFTPLINQYSRQTTRSVLAAILFHGLVNAGLEIFPLVGMAVNYSTLPLLFVGISYGILSLLLQKRIYPASS